jgi:hypothetical protein
MVYKLKTMTSLKRTNEDSGAVDLTTGKRDQSHNFTRLGAFLRKSHIDELPNLINFLRGELSLIGMRPLVPAEYGALPEKLRDAYASNKPAVFPVVYAFEGSPTPDDPKCDQQRLDFLQKFYDELAERPIVTRLKYGLVIAKRIFWDKKLGV